MSVLITHFMRVPLQLHLDLNQRMPPILRVVGLSCQESCIWWPGHATVLSMAFDEMLYAADSSFALYSALSSGACLSIDAHASVLF